MDENAFYDPANFVYPAGTQICEVEIDPETGVTEIVSFTAVDDFGNIINPMIVEGQVHGGIVQGAGQALYEAAVYDKKTGQLVSGSYMDYRMPRADDIVDEIAPRPEDVVIQKTKPSAFFGTPLLSFLIDLKVDSLIVCGGTTSGCVRAAVIDAFSQNLRCAVVAEGCFDRLESSHAMNLVDMQAKYADVVTAEEVLSFVATLPDGLFVLPGAR